MAAPGTVRCFSCQQQEEPRLLHWRRQCSVEPAQNHCPCSADAAKYQEIRMQGNTDMLPLAPERKPSGRGGAGAPPPAPLGRRPRASGAARAPASEWIYRAGKGGRALCACNH
ncbi:hypothetical protein [Desulfovibrio falkowii]|uniref:hypothetical protein n=1 Tax=Desulfovibrio sp. WGS1351 TaxID=3366814 RepID=UPI00372CF77F